MKIARSTYYYRPENREKIKIDANLQDRIESVALEFPKYGYRRITHQLNLEGISVNHKRILRIMRESSLLVTAKKRWIATTESNHNYPIYPNLIKERPPKAINQIWITIVGTVELHDGKVMSE